MSVSDQDSSQDSSHWMNPEELAEAMWGPEWRKHPDYLKARQWVLDKFYSPTDTKP